MNKTFTAALAISAISGLALADRTPATVDTPPAGYWDITSAAKGSEFVINPFSAFNGSLTLGDIDGSALENSSSEIKIFAAKTGKKLLVAKWKAANAEPEGPEGWYAADATGNLTSLTNSHAFNRGDSIQFVAGAASETITFAGVLNTNACEITCGKGHNFVGNVVPTTRNLSLFTVTGNYDPVGADYIFIRDTKYAYLNPTLASTVGMQSGWYLYSDLTGSNPTAASKVENVDIGAGEGFRAWFLNGATINAPGL